MHARALAHRYTETGLVPRRDGIEHKLDERLELGKGDLVVPPGPVKGVAVDALASRIGGRDREMFEEAKRECRKTDGDAGRGKVDSLVIPLVEGQLCRIEMPNISASVRDPIDNSEQRTLTRETHRDRDAVEVVFSEPFSSRATGKSEVAHQALQRIA